LLISLTVSFGKKYPVPDIYEVRLVMPEGARANTPSQKKEEAAAAPRPAPALKEKASTVPPVEAEKKKEPEARDWKKDYMSKQERLLALSAIKNVEKRVRLRETLNIEKNSSKGDGKTAPFKAEFPSNLRGATEGDPALMRYVAGFSDWVHDHYIFPDMKTMGIEAIISVIFLKDGRVVIKNFEKKSGNPLFDQAVVRAIEKSSPYKPPPYEFELGIRFSP